MADWNEGLRAAGTYIGVAAIFNLAWESLQLPLYTLWTSAAPWETAFTVIHCTVGDMMITASTLIAAIVVRRGWSWPSRDWKQVALLTIVAGLAYTVFSEWINVYVRHAWAYSAAMPIVRLGGIELGLSPLLQWLIVPSAAFTIVKRGMIRIAPG